MYYVKKWVQKKHNSYSSTLLLLAITIYLQISSVVTYGRRFTRLKVGPLFIKKKENKKKFEKRGPQCLLSLSVCLSVCVSVCVSVCSRPVGHSFWPRVLIFGMKDPWVHHSKRIILFFEILRFDLLMVIFIFFFGCFLLYILC